MEAQPPGTVSGTGRGAENLEFDLPFGLKKISYNLGCGVVLALVLSGIAFAVMDKAAVFIGFIFGAEDARNWDEPFFFTCSIIACLIGAAIFIVFCRDEYLNHPRKIVIDEQGVELKKVRREEYVSWNMIKKATHEEEVSWTLKTEEEDLVIEEDWVSDAQWEQVVNTLNSRLRARSIPIEFEAWDEDDEEDDEGTSEKEARYQERIASLEARLAKLEDQEK